MSYKTEFQLNNEDLQGLINKANALPDMPVVENLDSEIATQDSLIDQISATLLGKMAVSAIQGEIYFGPNTGSTYSMTFPEAIGKNNIAAIGDFDPSTPTVGNQMFNGYTTSNALIIDGICIAANARASTYNIVSNTPYVTWDSTTGTLAVSRGQFMVSNSGSKNTIWHYIAW